jgi:hypothetical protein
MREFSMETEHEFRFLTVDSEEVMDIVHHNLENAEQTNILPYFHTVLLSMAKKLRANY